MTRRNLLITATVLGGLQGSAQFLAFAAGQPSKSVLLNDENSYVTPDCASSTSECPRFLGGRMDVHQIGDEVKYDVIEGRWLPINKYPIMRLHTQRQHQYALWVGKAIVRVPLPVANRKFDGFVEFK
jgi:hypothetical protein